MSKLKMNCPFCKSDKLRIIKVNSPKTMGVYTEYENDLSLFQEDIVLINCGILKHGFFIDKESIKDEVLPMQNWEAEDEAWLSTPLTDAEQKTIDDSESEEGIEF